MYFVPKNMRQSVEDVKRLQDILGSSLDSTVIQEDFGQVVVRLEARQLANEHQRELQRMISDVGDRGLNGASAHVKFDEVSRRVYYLAPERDEVGPLEVEVLSAALKEVGIRVSASR